MFEQYDDILTLEEFCVAAKVGKNTAYTLLTSGTIQGYKSGRGWKIPKIALQNYIEEQVRSCTSK